MTGWTVCLLGKPHFLSEDKSRTCCSLSPIPTLTSYAHYLHTAFLNVFLLDIDDQTRYFETTAVA